MILDKITNYKLYAGLGQDFKEAFELLLNNQAEKAPGRYDFKNGMFYLVQSYETKPEAEGFFEAHRKYIDLQFIASGKERHDYAHISTLKIRDNYDDEKDFISFDGKGAALTLDAGYFAIYFPEDGHKPNLRVEDKAEAVTKVVFKIPCK